MKSRRLTLIDTLLVALLILLSITALALTLNQQHHWGDDFSVYIQQGIAIAEGRFDEQALECAQTRWMDAPLYYVWGHSLFLSLVYHAVGFDRTSFESIIYYKLPSAFSLTLMSVLCYLWLRRRFSRGVSFAGGSIFALGTQSIILANEIMTDIPYAASCLLFFLLADIYFERTDALHGFLLGAAAFASYLFRYTGATLLVALALFQLLFAAICIFTKKYIFSSSAFFAHVAPYAAFAFLYLFTGLFMPFASSEINQLSFYPSLLLKTIKEYLYFLRLFFYSFLPFPRYILLILCAAMLTTGIIYIHKKETYFLIFLVLTMLGLFSLPYTQGMRYIFNLLPLYLLFFLHGVRFFWHKLLPSIPKAGRIPSIIKMSAFIVMLFTLIHGIYPMASANIKACRRPQADGPYTKATIDVYHHIREKIPTDKRIMTRKARALSLNTGRVCYQSWGSRFDAEPLSQRLDEMDYLLITNELSPTPAEAQIFADPALASRMKPVFSSGTFTLYKITPPVDSAPSASATQGGCPPLQRLAGSAR